MNLNTQQIVLLCLLVSFVTSIATGITVVSLTNQSSEPVTRTINRVVERTIERVVEPEEEQTKNNTVATPERIVETVVVNQEDLTIDAVSKNSKSLVRIHVDNRNEIGDFVTLGIVSSSDSIVVDKNMISKNGKYFAKTNLGDLPVEIIEHSEDTSFAMLKLKNGVSGLEPATFSNSNSLQLAQTVISLSGASDNSVSAGIINKIDAVEKTEGDNVSTEVEKIYAGVDANNVLVGSILLNLKGSIIGFKNFDPNVSRNVFIPSNLLKNFIDSKISNS